MRADKLTTKFQEALSEAQSLAVGQDHPYIEPAHLLAAMLRQDEGPKALLQRAGVNVTALLSGTDEQIKKLPQVQGQELVQPGRDLLSLLQSTEKEAMKRGDQFVASELFLLALCDFKGDLGKLVKANGMNRKSLESAIDAVRGGQNMDSADAEDQRESLKKYCIDLTERARMGKLDPVIGRDDEIRRAIQVLQYFLRDSRWSSASALLTFWPPRTASMADSSDLRVRPLSLAILLMSCLVSVSASKNSSPATNWSPRLMDSFSAACSSETMSRPICTCSWP